MPSNGFDVHPQLLTVSTVESSVNTWTTTSVQCPILQNVKKGGAIVMEIGGLQFTVTAPEVINVTDTTVRAYLMHRDSAAEPALNDPNVIHRQVRRSGSVDTAATDTTLAVVNEADTKDINLQVGGKGIIHAHRTIWIGIVGSNNTVAKEVVARILYRLVEIDATELAGMLAN